MSRQTILLACLLFALANTPLRAEPADEQYLAAANHYSQGRWSQAREAFQAFIAAYPTHVQNEQARFYLGESLIQLRQHKEAAAHFHQFLLRRPSESLARKALFRAGEASYFAAQYEMATADLTKFLNQHPADKLNAYVLAYLGDMALERGDAAKASQFYSEGLERFPQSAIVGEYRLGIAKSLERQDKLNEAREMYATLAARDDEWADDAQLRLASSYFDRKDFDAASAAFKAFLEKHAASPLAEHVKLLLGQALYHQKEYVEAEKILLAIALASPQANEIRYWIGLAQLGRAAWKEAADTFQGTVAADPQHPLAAQMLVYAADALLRDNQPADAQKLFARVLRDWPQSEAVNDCLLGQVRCAVATGDHSAVCKAAKAFAQKCPEHEQRLTVSLHHARSLIAQSKLGDVVAVLEPLIDSASQAAPSDDLLTARYLLALAYQGEKRADDVQRALAPLLESKSAALAETRQEAWRLKSAVLVAQGKFSEAIAPLTLYLQTPSADGEQAARAQLSICFARTKQTAEARKAFASFKAGKPTAELQRATVEALAEAALANGDAAWAAELFDGMADRGNGGEVAKKGQAGKAWALYQAKQLPEAEVAFAALLRDQPDDPTAPDAALARARILEQLNRPEADSAYQLLIDKYGKSPQVATALLADIRAAEQQQKFDRAAALYARLLPNQPTGIARDWVIYNGAWSLQQSGKTDQARQWYERLRVEHGESSFWADATYRLAEMAVEAKQPQVAKPLLGELLARNDKAEIRAHALYVQAQLTLAEEKWSETTQSLDQLLKEFPQHSLRPLAEFWLAEIAYRQQKYDDALRRFNDLQQSTIGQTADWLGMIPLRRAHILVHQKKYAEAYEVALRIAQSYPQFEQQYEVEYLLGRCYSAAAEFDKARDAYRKAIQLAGASNSETAAMAQWMLGETFFHQQKYAEALTEYQRVDTLYSFPTWKALALLQAGKCHEHLGQWAQATENYVRLMKDFPTTSVVDEASRRLQAARQNVNRK